MITPAVTSGKEVFTGEIIDINYEHIPFQTVLKKAETKLSRISIETRGQRIAYLMGAGDDIPMSLRQIGYNVEVVRSDEISLERLIPYDALIIGVRAYNTEESLEV